MREQHHDEGRYVATNLEAVLNGQGRMRSWLVARVGISESLVSKIVAGTRTVDRTLGEAVATAVGVPFSVLFALRERIETVS